MTDAEIYREAARIMWEEEPRAFRIRPRLSACVALYRAFLDASVAEYYSALTSFETVFNETRSMFWWPDGDVESRTNALLFMAEMAETGDLP